jgi:hypothetical protein
LFKPKLITNNSNKILLKSEKNRATLFNDAKERADRKKENLDILIKKEKENKYKFNNKTSEKYLLLKFMNDISSAISDIFSNSDEINIDEFSKQNFRPYLN